MMRIITGSAKGIKLKTLEGMSTRPTTERAKEAVFSSIQFELSGRHVLDLFGGSGQLGLEALSRGAADAQFVDASGEAIAVIRENSEKTKLADKCRISRCKWDEFVRRNQGKRFDLVFLDPPYALNLIGPVIKALIDADMLDDGAIVSCEAGTEDMFGEQVGLLEQFEEIKTSHYSICCVKILRFRKGDSK